MSVPLFRNTSTSFTVAISKNKGQNVCVCIQFNKCITPQGSVQFSYPKLTVPVNNQNNILSVSVKNEILFLILKYHYCCYQ